VEHSFSVVASVANGGTRPENRPAKSEEPAYQPQPLKISQVIIHQTPTPIYDGQENEKEPFRAGRFGCSIDPFIKTSSGIKVADIEIIRDS
jgi:hypothetical protein